MALSKIELKLGKKVITLTPEQFEELKADMRELDKNHHYYWNNSPWDRPYYTYTTCTTGIDQQSQTPNPPSFNGSILSTS